MGVPNTQTTTCQIEWKECPESELYPVKELPDLPEGWDLYIDPNMKVIYIDTYAEVGIKKCFWTPPIKELYPNSRTPYGWEKKTTIFGRIYWQDQTYGVVSYKHQLHTKAILWDDVVLWRIAEHAQGNRDYVESLWERPLSHKKQGSFRLSDREVPCQMTAEVWEHGWSDAAMAKRRHLWWGRRWDRQYSWFHGVEDLDLRRSRLSKQGR